MAAPFAALEARLNQAVFSRLSNAQATLAGGMVTGIFNAAYAQESMGGFVAASEPTFTLASSAVPAIVAGAVLVVNGVTYSVIEPMPSGDGITVLRLRT